MKKVLGWAIVAICMAMAIYSSALDVPDSGDPSSDALLAVFFAVGATFIAFDCTLRAILAFLFVVLVGPFSSLLAAALSALFIAFGAYKVATEAGAEFKWVFLAYLIEGAGIYGSLKTGFWQPAAIAALFLGVWWLVIRLAEKVRPAVSI